MTDLPVPKINYSFAPSDGHNVFREKFGSLTDDQWAKLLERSLTEANIDGVPFATYPDAEFQNRVHGNSGADSLNEAVSFFRFIKDNTYGMLGDVTSKRLLDFGTGWGRMIRPFMRDFEFKHLFGFEPDFLFCSLARTLNPYVQFLTGNFVPNGDLPEYFFDLMISWSVFSHLSPSSAVLWLKEAGRVIKPGGICVFTTWGDRFLKRLQRESSERAAGLEVHWYSSICINAAGSIDKRLSEYEQGEFVWFTNTESMLWGEAFIGEKALRRMIWEFSMPFEILTFDRATLSQDAIVLRRL